MKASDRRITPNDLREATRAFGGGHIHYDPCTEKNNPLDAVAFTCRPKNGLHTDWRATAIAAAHLVDPSGSVIPTVWHNPTWSARFEWDMAACLYGGNGCAVLTFSMVDFTAPWWRLLSRFALLRCELDKRPKCLDPVSGNLMEVARSGVVWLCGDEEHAQPFRDAFAHLGGVVPPGSPETDALERVSLRREVSHAAE